MEKMNGILRKCKGLSKLGRCSSYSGLRSKPTRDDDDDDDDDPTSAGESHGPGEGEVLVFVGSSRRPYVISVKHLNHPLLSTLLERPKEGGGGYVTVKCEVVLFDHLLWMLENVDLDVASGGESLEELAGLYAY